MATRPSLATYRDFRAYLRDHYTWKKARRPGFSWRLLAKLAGLQSPNYLHLVATGKRNLAEESSARVASALGLEGDEAALFCALVSLDRAQDDLTRRNVEEKAAGLVQRLSRQWLGAEQLDALRAWSTLVVFESLRLDSPPRDADAVATLLGKRVSRAAVEASLRTLQDNGLVIMEAGRLRPGSSSEVGVSHTQSPELTRRYFQECLEAWMDILPGVGPAEGMFRVVTLPTNIDCLPELKERVRAFQDEIVAWLEAQPGKDRVVQLGLLCLPVTAQQEEP